jgi:hypothetical protein
MGAVTYFFFFGPTGSAPTGTGTSISCLELQVTQPGAISFQASQPGAMQIQATQPGATAVQV